MVGETDAGRLAGAAITPDTRWMTYRELAELLVMKEESARRRAQREGWPRQLGNDGRTRVGVPGDAAPDEARTAGAANGGDDCPDDVAMLRGALARERERANWERERAGRAEAVAATVPELREALGKERERADRAEAELAGAAAEAEAGRKRAEEAERQREEARVKAAAGEAEVRGLKEALAEARRPFWRRWLGP